MIEETTDHPFEQVRKDMVRTIQTGWVVSKVNLYFQAEGTARPSYVHDLLAGHNFRDHSQEENSEFMHSVK
jgi:hypothetical protein